MSPRILLLTLTVCLCAAAPATASSGQPGGLCSGPAVSAQSQYCENVPSAATGRGPQLGSPAGRPGSVGATFPPSVQRAIARSDQLSPRRQLLALPPRVSASTMAPTPLTGADANVFGLMLPLLLALAAIVVGMGLAAAHKRRRRTAGAA